MDIIVCIDKNNGIGKDGGLLFRIPEDMAYFRRMTVNKTVIMGRKTLESLPGGRPLENRRNIVLTRNRDRVPNGADAVSSIDELKRAIGSDKAFVIGGESIYAMLLDYCERAYVTEVEDGSPADTAGIQTGDIIVEADGTVITSTSQLISILQSKNVGDTASIKLYRSEGITEAQSIDDIKDGQYQTVSVVLAILDNVKQ